MNRSAAFLLALVLLSGCAGKPVAVALAPATAPAATPAVVAMPAGARAGMAIPALMADGRYATPNRDLSPAATLWHLRAALNVAALACRGAQQAPIVAGYNAMLARDRAPLAAAEQRYAAEYRATGAVDWRDRYDDALTRLYNFFAQSEARDGFCAAAATIVADSATADPAARLAALERPFTDFYRAYDLWRQRTDTNVIAVAAVPAQPQPRVAVVLDGLGDTIVTGGETR